MLCICRVLLTALAVSCTLSRTSAHGPSTQRLDRIKDLICVLLLSGMQKEDLDVKMLNKLERHNVNIHDMNNEELLKTCIQNNSNVYNTIITVQPHNQVNEEDLVKRNNIKTETPIVNVNTEAYENNTKSKVKLKIIKNKEAIQYIDGQPELQSVLKFWKDIEIAKSLTELPPQTSIVQGVPENLRYDQKNKRNLQDTYNSYEADTIQRLLANFLLQRNNRHVVRTTETSFRNIELYNNVFGADKKPTDSFQNVATIMEPLLKESKIKEYIPYTVIDTLKPYYIHKTDDTITDTLRLINKESNTSNENLHFNRFVGPSSLTKSEKVNSSIEEQKISQKMIQEIAKSVKELVLSDLRKEILHITTQNYYTTVRTTVTTTTEEYKADNQISSNNGRDKISEQYILNKFIDLFKEMKSLNHKTVVISSEIRKENDKVSKDRSIQSSIYTYPLIPTNKMDSPIASYGINQYTNFKIQKSFDFSPQIHKFRSKEISKSKKQVSAKSTQPITFQTNNMEIPPLGIAVDKPENPINQNIIVPTLTPYRIGDYKFDFNQMPLPNRANTNGYLKKLSNIPLLKTAEVSLHQINSQNTKRLPLQNFEFTDNNEISYKQISNRAKVKSPIIPRYHEKLEKKSEYLDVPEQREYVDRIDCCNEKYSYSKQMVECCNHKVASRQQMSLNAMKKQSYDETHFKNFLKSQQKVTDMLERVLASRSKVRSVETS